MQAKLWMIGLALLCVLVGLLFWISPEQQTPDTHRFQSNQNSSQNTVVYPVVQDKKTINVVSPSQQDIEINCQFQLDAANKLIVNEHVKNCFEYFVSQYGEHNINQIQQNFQQYLQQLNSKELANNLNDLWSRYLAYRQQLTQLSQPTVTQQDPSYFQIIFTMIQQLRQQHFSAYEIIGLFGQEDLYHRYSLERMQVTQDAQLSEIEKAQKLQQLFAELPQDWQNNLKQINQLEDLRTLSQAIKKRGGTAEELHHMRVALVGEEATQRLENLDQQRQEWKSQVQHYLTQRQITLESGLSHEAKQAAVQQLRQQIFPNSQEHLRLKSFEMIHDQGGILPFAE